MKTRRQVRASAAAGPHPLVYGGILALTLLACSESRSELPRGPEPRPQPSAPSAESAPRPAPELPGLEHERLDYLFEVAALVAQRWPTLSANEVCVLLLGRTAQWVVHCHQAPAGFRRTDAQFRGRPIFAHAGDSFEVSGEERNTSELLAKMPAAAHVFGIGSRASALSPEHPWLLLGTLEALRAFHPAFPPATTEHWLSVAVHELVHIHQLRQPRFAPYVGRIDAGELHPGALTALYEHDAAFRMAIAREYEQLTKAAAIALDPASAQRALRGWLQSYHRRSALLAKRPDGAKLLHDERLFTYLEGVGRFVESDFLVNDAQHPRTGLAADPDFHGFSAFAGGGYALSPNRQLDPQYYYAIGYHLCVLLSRVDPSWHRRVDSQQGWLIGLVERVVQDRGRK